MASQCVCPVLWSLSFTHPHGQQVHVSLLEPRQEHTAHRSNAIGPQRLFIKPLAGHGDSHLPPPPHTLCLNTAPTQTGACRNSLLQLPGQWGKLSILLFPLHRPLLRNSRPATGCRTWLKITSGLQTKSFACVCVCVYVCVCVRTHGCWKGCVRAAEVSYTTCLLSKEARTP